MTEQGRPVDPLRREAHAVRSELAKLASGIATLHRRMEQLSALQDGEKHAAAQIARLERVLDFDRVAAYVRGAVTRAEVAGDPVPHLLVANLLPPDVYEALIEAIPAHVFLDGRAERGQDMRVPPRLAPMPSIVTWMFLDEIARALSDLLVARLAEPLALYTQARFPSLPPFRDWGVELTLSEGRLVRRAPGYAGRPPVDRPWDVVTSVLYLARHQDTEEYGSQLQAAMIPFRANSALAYVGPVETHAYASIPSDAPEDVERYTYEFGIGPTRDARRTLTAPMRK